MRITSPSHRSERARFDRLVRCGVVAGAVAIAVGLGGAGITGFVPTAQAQTTPAAGAQQFVGLPSNVVAALNAGDVQTVSSFFSSTVQNNPTQVQAIAQSIAEVNPNVTGAVINGGLRDAATTGTPPAVLGQAVQAAMQGAVGQVASRVPADQVSTFADNLADNVRQAISAIAGGNEALSAQLLASARTGTDASLLAVNEELQDQVSAQLLDTISDEETDAAPDQVPIVVLNSPVQPGSIRVPVVIVQNQPVEPPVIPEEQGIIDVLVRIEPAEDPASPQ